MFKVTPEDVERWKRDSIETARSAELLDDPVLDILQGTKVEVVTERRPTRVWYGIVNYGLNKMRLYEENAFRFFPEWLREICNQSGMDHELIGHLGGFYSDRSHGETPASIVQVGMARERGETDILWKVASQIIPGVMGYHKKIPVGVLYGGRNYS